VVTDYCGADEIIINKITYNVKMDSEIVVIKFGEGVSNQKLANSNRLPIGGIS